MSGDPDFGKRIPAISIRQPYAAEILNGTKPIEFRTYSYRYRGDLLLHASRTIGAKERDRAHEIGMQVEKLPRGAIVGIARLQDYFVDSNGGGQLFCWHLADVRRFAEPIPYRGAASIFKVDLEIVREAINEAVAVDSHISWQGYLEAIRDESEAPTFLQRAWSWVRRSNRE